MESLAEYEFFTFLQQGDAEVAFDPPKEYWLDFYGGRLTLFFTLPLREARVMDASAVELDVFDPNYFVAFEMTQETPFAMVDAPSTCTLDFTPPPPLDPQTATTLAAIPQTGARTAFRSGADHRDPVELRKDRLQVRPCR